MSLNKYFRVCFVIVFGFAGERSRFVCLMWLLLLIWVIYFSVSLLSALEHSLFSQERLTVTSNNERFWWKPVNLRHVSTFSPYVHLPAWFEIDLLIFVFKSKHCTLGLQVRLNGFHCNYSVKVCKKRLQKVRSYRNPTPGETIRCCGFCL